MFSASLTATYDWLWSSLLSTGSVLGWMLDTVLQGTLLMALAYATTLLMRRASAARRHQVWLLAIAGLLALPLLNIIVPRRVALLPAQSRNEVALHTLTQKVSPDTGRVGQRAATTAVAQSHARSTTQHTARPAAGLQDKAPALSNGPDTAPAVLPAAVTPAIPSGKQRTQWTQWTLLVLVCWLTGVVIAAVRLLDALRSVRRLEHESVVLVEGPLVDQVREAQGALHLKRPLTLRLAREDANVAVPLTWGWRRGIVLLPAQAESWSCQQRRAILLHELAHVARSDWAALVLAQIACVLYWFHPLAWWAARAMRTESEQATDDQVVASGVRAGDYGECLLQFVRMLRAAQMDVGQRGSRMRLAIPMASPSTLENRLRALFDSRRSRRSLTPRDMWAGGVVTTVMLTLIAMLGLRSGTADTAATKQLTPSPQLSGTLKYVVTTTSDLGPGSLRQALAEAALTPGATIAFNIAKTDRNFRDGIFSISLNTELPAISADRTVIDGASQTAFTGDTNMAGPEVAIRGDLPTTREQGPQGAGVQVTAANCVLRSLIINGFASAVRIIGRSANGNRVQGCYLGTNATGTSVLVTEAHHATSVLTTPITTSSGNQIGVEISRGASHNTVGGTTAGARNVISGNLVYQVEINGGGTDSNIIQGNYIGVGADGKTPILTRSGVSIEHGAAKNVIGGTTAGARNVIVGYGREAFGIRIRYESHDNIVQGNYIGCDKDGTQPLGNAWHGVLVNKGAERNLIGGTVPGARNVLAAHRSIAVGISFANNNVVQGNYVGTTPAGNAALGTKGDSGVCVYAGSSNTVGGTTAGARNVISGNYRRAVLLMSEPGTPGTTDNVVQGNYIGTDATARFGVGEQMTGVAIRGAVGNTIGLALDGSGVGNRIAFNKGDGVRVYALANTPLASRNMLRGNLIYANGGPGINLQPETEPDNTVTPNDADDVDAGPNNGQNSPLITNIGSEDNKAAIVTTIGSTPNTKIIVDFYLSAAAEGAQDVPEAAYLGSAEATTDAVGKAAVTFKASVKTEGRQFTATATNAATGDTSEFSAYTSSSDSGSSDSGSSDSGSAALQ